VDAASRFQLVPDWHLDPSVFCQVISLWGTPQIDLRVAPVGAIGAFHVMASSGLAGGHRRSQHGLGLLPGLPLPSHSPPQRVVRKLEVSRGVFLLVTPYWEAQT
jgi:hypothetical protein